MDNSKPLELNSNFTRLFYELPEKEYKKLELELINSEMPVEIQTWSNCLADDINKYDICIKNNLPIEFVSRRGRSFSEVTIEMCRENLEAATDCCNIYSGYLIGIVYIELNKIINQNVPVGRRFCYKEELESSFANYNKYATRATTIIRKHFGSSSTTTRKFSRMAVVLDRIGKIDNHVKSELLTGKIHVSMTILDEMERIDHKTLSALVEYIVNNDIYSITKSDMDFFNVNPVRAKRFKEGNSIKEMPKPDPDLETNSLALTIPSWIGSITRTKETADFAAASYNSRKNLLNELWNLMESADEIIDILRGNTYE